MVKSHGRAFPVEHVGQYGEDYYSQNNDRSKYAHDHLKSRSSKAKGMDCVDSGIVRLNARQMSVDDTLQSDSAGTSTWFYGTADDSCNQESFPEGANINHVILSQIVEDDNNKSNEKVCEEKKLLTGDAIATFKRANEQENEEKNSLSQSGNEDKIIPTAVHVLKSENLPLYPKQVQYSQNESTELDVVDAPLPIKISVSTDVNKSNDWLPTFTIMDLVFAILGVCFFLFDIVTDWRLAFIYYFSDHMDMFYWTVGIILVPAVLSGIISLVWSYNDHRYSEDKLDFVMLVLKVVFSLLQLGRCFRNIVYIYYVIKSWRSPYHVRDIKKKALEHKHDSAVLGLVDGFLESALQLLLQLYFSMSRQIHMDFIRITSICLSWVSAALLHTSYYRNNRKVQKSKTNVGYTGALMYLCWRICELGPRFLLLSLFIYTIPYWISVPIATVHFSFVLIFYIVQRPKLEGICCSDMSGYPFLLLVSYIATFCYVNLTNDRSRIYATIYYVVFYLENIGMFVVTLLLFPDKNSYYDAWKNSSYIVFPGLVLHLLFQTLYYQYFHPNTYARNTGNENNACYKIRDYFKKKECWGIPFM